MRIRSTARSIASNQAYSQLPAHLVTPIFEALTFSDFPGCIDGGVILHEDHPGFIDCRSLTVENLNKLSTLNIIRKLVAPNQSNFFARLKSGGLNLCEVTKLFKNTTLNVQSAQNTSDHTSRFADRGD
jgi:hypothetical protein